MTCSLSSHRDAHNRHLPMGVVRQEAGRDAKSLIAPIGSFPVKGMGSTSEDAGRRDAASIMTSLRLYGVRWGGVDWLQR